MQAAYRARFTGNRTSNDVADSASEVGGFAPDDSDKRRGYFLVFVSHYPSIIPRRLQAAHVHGVLAAKLLEHFALDETVDFQHAREHALQPFLALLLLAVRQRPRPLRGQWLNGRRVSPNT